MIKNAEKVEMGTFEVESGKVIVSDPCYGLDTWCNGTLQNVKNGTWDAKMVVSYEGGWGKRVAYLIASVEGKNFNQNSFGWARQNIRVGVDSGQAGIFDVTHFKKDADAEGYEHKYDEIIGDDGEKGSKWYAMCCDKTLAEEFEGGGVIPYGCVSSSGYGDGVYNCSVIFEKDQIVGIMIDFGLDYEDEEEAEEEWEEENDLD